MEDDGDGFDVSALFDGADSHRGIENIRDRLKNVSGGDLKIESEIGKGTKAMIILPVE